MRFSIMEMTYSRLWILFLLAALVPADANESNNAIPDISKYRINHGGEQPPTIRPKLQSTVSPYTPYSPYTLYTTARPGTSPPPPPTWRYCPEKCHPVKLDLSKMSMGRFDGGVIDTQDVIFLNLSRNNINHLPTNSFLNLQSLHELDLSGNRLPITGILQLHHLKKLSFLWLDDNNSNETETVLTEKKGLLPHLKQLYLRGNRISEFSVSLTEIFPRLTHLYLSRNALTSTEFLKTVPDSLTHLHLDDNRINKIEDAELGNIVELSINRNKLEVLCVYICDEYSLQLLGAKKLKTLLLSGNQIRQFNLGEHDRRTIQPMGVHTLDLSNNKLTKITSDIIPIFNKLRNLNLSYNALTDIPSLCSLPALETLDLSGNRIVTVPAGIFCPIVSQHSFSQKYYEGHSLQQMRVLNLSNNKIVQIDRNSFSMYSRSLELDLSANLISKLPSGWITAPYTLRVLRLQKNNISDIRDIDLTGMSTLAELHIMRNPLTHIVVGSVSALSRELRVYFQDENYQSFDVDNNEEDDSDEDTSWVI